MRQNVSKQKCLLVSKMETCIVVRHRFKCCNRKEKEKEFLNCQVTQTMYLLLYKTVFTNNTVAEPEQLIPKPTAAREREPSIHSPFSQT